MKTTILPLICLAIMACQNNQAKKNRCEDNCAASHKEINTEEPTRKLKNVPSFDTINGQVVKTTTFIAREASISEAESKKLGVFVCSMKPSKPYLRFWGRKIPIPDAWIEHNWEGKQDKNQIYIHRGFLQIVTKSFFNAQFLDVAYVRSIGDNTFGLPHNSYGSNYGHITTADTALVALMPSLIKINVGIQLIPADTIFCLESFYYYPVFK